MAARFRFNNEVDGLGIAIDLNEFEVNKYMFYIVTKE